jgi:hypothetical protein
MQKPKQKLPAWRHVVMPVFMVLLSVIILVSTYLFYRAPGKACVSAPRSTITSLQVVAQGKLSRTDKTITNQHTIDCLADDLKHLPEMPSTPVICPVSDGSTYILSFDGGKVVSGTLSACQVVKIQGDSKTYWLMSETSYTKDMRAKLQKILQ